MAGFATRTSFAGHADSSAKTNHELTSSLDHQMGPASCLPVYCLNAFLIDIFINIVQMRDHV